MNPLRATAEINPSSIVGPNWADPSQGSNSGPWLSQKRSAQSHLRVARISILTILAYLVLGVVKTYSKKVEYLLDDCNDVLSEINKFVINTKNNAPVKAVRMAFIMPDTFELDAIDLGELEDTSGYHTAPPEQITLKEVLSNTGGFAQFSQERFEDFDMQFEGFGFGETSCSLDQLMAENSFLQFQPMDFDFEVFPSNSRNNLIEGSSGKQLEFQRKVPFEDGQSSANPLESTTINETPQSKFHDDSTARPKPKPGL
ncbi:sister chromatid cohesion 1 protein 2-like [Trifolium pratense]|uniref:Sister chromatid cohesion 1 protein 2-like n=1 Tax=Trifolium pratense TaxID=57577 RepID=A0A2K3N4A1_TRIPR|nr:sister chromatid cohesion 1 protein 2-like [Trifolium pratense]